MAAGRFMRHTNKDIKLEPASNVLASKLREMFPVGRMRTGTPPRLNKNTINYKGLEAQHSDQHVKWFNFENEFNGYQLQNGEIECHMTETNSETHKIITEHRHLLPDLGHD
jgi:tRNA uridine 5-carboxymethylaminomethyl modification enzyme